MKSSHSCLTLVNVARTVMNQGDGEGWCVLTARVIDGARSGRRGRGRPAGGGEARRQVKVWEGEGRRLVEVRGMAGRG